MAVNSLVRGAAKTFDLNLTPWERETHRLSAECYHPERSANRDPFPSRPCWQRLREVGTRLWLDTGDLDEASALWTREFTNCTTNNTLANKEVQKGLFDAVIREAGTRLRKVAPDMSAERLVYEVGFIVNCRLALRLVEALGATVSVELHPGMAHDIEASVRYGRRYFAVCPERFIIKVPLTPDGFLAARRLAADDIPVNFTLGFSARQNYLAARLSRTAYVNVFMGRLNAFVSDNKLGDGKYVGEKATLSTQRSLQSLRRERGWDAPLLIGASMRDGSQVVTLAGLDVFTLPPKVAAEFQEMSEKEPVALEDGTSQDFAINTAAGVDAAVVGLPALWDVGSDLRTFCDDLERQDVNRMRGADLVALAERRGLRMLRQWSVAERELVEADGKIPVYAHWEKALAAGEVGLDDLFTQAALHSFITDQRALDQRIQRLLE
jgi:transaldolase